MSDIALEKAANNSKPSGTASKADQAKPHGLKELAKSSERPQIEANRIRRSKALILIREAERHQLYGNAKQASAAV